MGIESNEVIGYLVIDSSSTFSDVKRPRLISYQAQRRKNGEQFKVLDKDKRKHWGFRAILSKDEFHATPEIALREYLRIINSNYKWSIKQFKRCGNRVLAAEKFARRMRSK